MSSLPFSIFVLLLLLRLPGVLSVRILQIVPGFTNSHVLFNYRLAQTLVDMDHNVTLWTQMEMAMVFAGDLKLPDGVSEQRVPIHFRDRLKVEGLKVFQEMIFARGTPYELWWTGREFQEMRLEACEQMLHKADALREKWGHFDLAIGHFHDLCPVMLAERVGVERMVWVTHGTSLYDFTAITLGIRTFPSFVPHPLSSNGDRMAFTGRLVNLLWHLSGIEFVNLPERLLHDENKIYEKVSNGRANLWSLSARSVPVLLINGERFLDFPRPLPLNIGFMGELATVGKKAGGDGDVVDELEPDLASVYSRTDSKGDGVEYVQHATGDGPKFPGRLQPNAKLRLSVEDRADGVGRRGQNAECAPEAMDPAEEVDETSKDSTSAGPWRLQQLSGGLFPSQLPYPPRLLDKAKAAKVGVPVVLVPLFADQHINAERAKRFGIAVTLDKLALSAEAIRAALSRVLEDRRYSLNARRLSTMLTDTPPASPRIAPPVHLRHSLKLALSDRTELFTLKAAQALGFVQFHCVDLALPLALLTALLSAASR